MPSTIAIEPPDTPGTIIVEPTTNPLIIRESENMLRNIALIQKEGHKAKAL